jgi:peptidoglycan/LPS O-acetylase OafA/YrhL
MKSSTSNTHNNILRIAFVTACILLIPFVAMQFSDSVNWTLLDFAVAGSLLFGTGLMYELLSRRTQKRQYRRVIGATLIVALVLIWLELAVGLFD